MTCGRRSASSCSSPERSRGSSSRTDRTRPAMNESSRREATRTARSAWRSTSLALALAAAVYSTGCVSSRQGSGDVPDCPPWTTDAIEELETILARGESPALEAHIAEQLAYCEAIERWNDESLAPEPRSCWPRTWREWTSLLFALECQH